MEGATGLLSGVSPTSSLFIYPLRVFTLYVPAPLHTHALAHTTLTPTYFTLPCLFALSAKININLVISVKRQAYAYISLCGGCLLSVGASINAFSALRGRRHFWIPW